MRVRSSSSGGVLSRHDYYPFGGERVVTDTCPQPYKFTHSTHLAHSGQAGQERDAESGLDYFLARPGYVLRKA